MPTDLRARVSIDDKVVEAISELKRDRSHKSAVGLLKEQGHSFITEFVLYNIQSRLQQTVPYEFYLDLVGKEGAEEIPWEQIHFTESFDLVRKIAHWHCFFFDVKKGKFTEEVVREAKVHGLEYALHTMYGILFFGTEIKRVNPAVTDIAAKMFNTANGRSYSLNQIEDLVNYFDNIIYQLSNCKYQIY